MNKTKERRSMSYEAARMLIDAAVRKAESMHVSIAAVVLDDGGNLIAFGKMDNAPLISITASQKKALTAVGFGMKTGDEWYRFIKDDPILLHGAPQLDNFSLLGGGIPVRVDGMLIGALGVSGGHYQTDEACAESAIQEFQNLS